MIIPNDKGIPLIEHRGVQFNPSGIKSILFHRGPSLLIDGVVAFNEKSKTLTAHRYITPDSPEVKGHFPGNPVLPLTKAAEMGFQAAALLSWCLFEDIEGLPMAKKINPVAHKPILPGVVYIKVKLEKFRKPFFFFSGQVVNERQDEVLAELNNIVGVLVTFEQCKPS